MSFGENIGMGTTSAEYMVTLWMNSTGHQAAILSRSTTHIGVGYYLGHWVQLFSYGPDEKCVFTIDANGGIFEDGASVKSFQFPLKQSHITFMIHFQHLFAKDTNLMDGFFIIKNFIILQLMEMTLLRQHGFPIINIPQPKGEFDYYEKRRRELCSIPFIILQSLEAIMKNQNIFM